MAFILSLLFLSRFYGTGLCSDAPFVVVSPRFIEIGKSIKLKFDPDLSNDKKPASCCVLANGTSCGVRLNTDTFVKPVEYALNSVGQHDIDFSCTYGNDQKEENFMSVYVYEEMEGFQLKPGSNNISAADLQSGNAFIYFTFSSGRYMEASYFTPSGTPSQGRVFIDEDRQEGYFSFVPEDFSSFGTKTIKAMFLNKLTISLGCCEVNNDKPVTITVKYEEELADATFDVKSVILYNKSTELSASASLGTNVCYLWSTSLYVIWEICFQSASSSTISLLPMNYDPIDVNITISNYLSSSASFNTISIVKPVAAFEAFFEYNTDERMPSVVVIAPAQSYFPMGSLNAEVYSGLGTVRDKSPLKIEGKTQKNLDIPLEGPPPWSSLYVRISSEVSNQTIQVLSEPVTVSVRVDTPYGVVGQPVEIDLTNSVGPGFHYVLGYGDGNNTYADLRAQFIPSDITLRHTYNRPGVFVIMLFASNSVDTKHSDVTITIVGLQVSADPVVTFPSGLASVEIQILGLLDVTCKLEFGDNSDGKQVSGNDTVPHRYVTPGTFNLTLACQLSPALFRRVEIDVKPFGPSDFIIHYDTVVLKNLTEVTVDFRIDLFGVKVVPPGVQFTWNFMDGTIPETYLLTTWLKSHSFMSRGNYNISLSIETSADPVQSFTLPIRIGMVQFTVNRYQGIENTDEFGFEVSDLPKPTANIKLDYGDTTNKEFRNWTTGEEAVLTVSHVYKTAGAYQPMVTVWAEGFYELVSLTELVFVNGDGSPLDMTIEPAIQSPPGNGKLTFTPKRDAVLIGSVTCVVDYGDGSVIETVSFSFESLPDVTLHHKFEAFGDMDIVANCSFSQRPTAKLHAQTIVTSTCYQSKRPMFNVDSPVLKAVSEQFLLSAYPDVQCVHLTPVFSWQIAHLLSPNTTEPIPTDTNSTLLVLPPRSMKDGVYLITFYTHFAEMPSIYKTDSVLVIYEKSPLVANIKGGTLKTIDEFHEIAIDALTFSHDPDVNAEEEGANLMFTWSMSSYESFQEAASANINGTRNFCSLCNRVSAWKTGLLVFPPGCLPVGRWNVFYVTVSKDSRRSSAHQIIFVSSGNRQQVDIRCKVNCMEKVNAEFSFNLESECLTCNRTEQHQLAYEWRLFRLGESGEETQVSRFEVITGTGTARSTMAIHPYSFSPGEAYLLLLTHRLPGGPATTIRRDFTVNYPPYNGTCYVTPSSGYAVYDLYQVVCEGWIDEADRRFRSEKDDDKYLQYRFFLHSNGKPSLLYSGGSRMTTKQHFNVGDEDDDYNVQVTVRIFDWYKGMAEVNVTTKVIPPLTRTNGSDLADQLDTMLSDFDAEINQALASGDVHSVLRLSEAAGSSINSLNLPNMSSVAPFDYGDWMGDLPLDMAGPGSPESWDNLWQGFQNPETMDEQHKLTMANAKYLETIAKSVNSSNIASLDTVYMASSSLNTLLSDPDYVSNAGKKAAIETVDVLGESLGELVSADMSDTQVNEVLNSLYGTVDQTLTGVTPVNPIAQGDLQEQSSIKEIDLQRKYLSKAAFEQAESRLQTADLHDEERAFFSTRAKLQKNYYDNQLKQMAQEGMGKLEGTVNNLLDSASTFLVEGQEPVLFRAPNMASRVEKRSMGDIFDEDIQFDDIGMRLAMKEFLNEDMDITHATLKSTVFDQNPYTWENEDTVARITSPAVCVNLSAVNPWDESIDMSPTAYNVFMPNPTPVVETTVNPVFNPLDLDQMLYHRMELKSTEDTLLVSLRPSTLPVVYDVYFRSGEFPTSTDYHYHTVARFEENVTKVITCPTGYLPTAGTTFVGLRPRVLDHPRRRREIIFKNSGSSQSDAGTNEVPSAVKNGEYDLGVAAVSCTQWMDPNVKWDGDVCKVGNVTSFEGTSCACELPLTSIFTIATTFYLPVNMVDFSTVFKEIDLQNNSSVFTVVIILLAIYSLLLVWARRKDTTDIIKWGVTALADNASDHRYLYVITVYTGMRMAAGTKSKVAFVLVGEKGDTGVRPLDDGIRSGFPKQSVMHFLMAVENCLGDLQYIRIWHDNSGKGSLASWFLHKIVVEDLQEDKKFTFTCDKWLGVDESDGLINRLVPVSSRENLLNFSSLFYSNARKNVTDSHIWFSVLFRPQRSHFTRVQRLSCCACLLFLSMICNALFYQGRDNIVRPTTVNLGFLRLSVHQVYTSVISIFIVTPVELAVIWLFKKSKPQLRGPIELVKSGSSFHSCFLPRDRIKIANALLTKNFVSPKGTLLPHFCVYVAWAMVILCITTSSFFVFLLSQQWGRAKSEEWLTSFLLTFIESLVILDPLKVILLAVFFAVFVHKLEEDSNELNKDEIRTNCGSTVKNQEEIQGPVKPLEADEVEKVRVERLRETKTFEVIKEIGLYLLFLAVMCAIGYTNRDPRSFHLKRNIHNMLLHTQQDGRLGLNDVRTVEEYFSWLNKTAFPALFHESYFNNSRRRWTDRFFIRDLQNLRVGPPRLRQVRITGASDCAVPWLSLEPCGSAIAYSHEDSTDYCIGWKGLPCPEEEKAFKLTSDAWKYTSSREIWGMPVIGVYNSYGGGGYIAELNVNLDVSTSLLQELFSAMWIDKKTRLLTLDFTVYNANTNLFCFVSLISEFPGTGGTITTTMVSPFRVYQYAGSLGNFVFFTEMTFVILLAVAVVKLVLKLVKHGVRYLCDPWHVVDFFSLIACFVAIAMYGLRKFSTEMAIHRHDSDSRQFINFQQVTFWDSTMVAMVGLVTFTCTIRTVKILGFSRRLYSIIAVMAMARRDLFYFSLMFVIFLMAFVACGYFMFGQNLKAYHTVLTTCETLMTSLVGKSPFNEVRHQEPVMAQIYFSTFVFFFVFVLLTMFQVILNQSIALVRNNKNFTSSQHEMIDVLKSKLQPVLCFFSRPKDDYGKSDSGAFSDFHKKTHPVPMGTGSDREMWDRALLSRRHSRYIHLLDSPAAPGDRGQPSHHM